MHLRHRIFHPEQIAHLVARVEDQIDETVVDDDGRGLPCVGAGDLVTAPAIRAQRGHQQVTGVAAEETEYPFVAEPAAATPAFANSFGWCTVRAQVPEPGPSGSE